MLIVAVIPFLFACTDTVSIKQIDWAIKACEQNGGLDYVTADYFNGNTVPTTAHCKDGVTVSKALLRAE